MKFCKEAAGKKCEVAVSYEKCGAYASSKKYSGSGAASNEADAKKKALGECNAVFDQRVWTFAASTSMREHRKGAGNRVGALGM